MTPRIPRRLARFCVVGASGVAVNMGILILLTEMFRVPYALASLVAIEVSIVTNFALNNAWTWSDCKSESLLRRILKYHAVAGLTALGANWCVLMVLTRFAGLDYRLSNLIGIGVGVALNFILNHLWTFSHSEAATVQPDGACAILPPSLKSSDGAVAQTNHAPD